MKVSVYFLFLILLANPFAWSEEDKFPNFLPNIDIIYSANTFGEIDPCGCRGNPMGGLSRRWNWLKTKSTTTEKLSLDSGDLFYEAMDIPYFKLKQWNAKANALVIAYNQLHIDAMTPGELDFAAGLKQFLDLKRKSKFKIISANIFYKKTKKPLLEGSVLIEKGGKKIGIFAVIDDALKLPPELKASDPFVSAKTEIQKLKNQGAVVLLAITHLGLEKDRQLAKLFPELNAIFGSHSQSFLITPEKVGNTLIMQPSLRGQHIGLYSSGENSVYQIDERFISPKDKPNPMDKLVEKTNLSIAKLNQQMDADMGLTSEKANVEKHFQTFPQCASCHTAQYQFYQTTQHAKAFETLIKAKQSKNFDCLGCHTLGMQKPGGYQHVDKLVIDNNGKPVDLIRFTKELPTMTVEHLSKIRQAFVNVQCEHCHVSKDSGSNHPFEGSLQKTVTKNTCMTCHTPERAPKWYEKGKINQKLVEKKIKSIACPADLR